MAGIQKPQARVITGKAYSFASFIETDPRTARHSGAFVKRSAILFATK